MTALAGMREQYGDSTATFVEWTPAAGAPRARIVALHGGYWRAAYDLVHLRPVCTALAGLGFDVVSIEYRKLGEPGGGWPGTFEDVTRALNTLASRVPSLERDGLPTLLLGHSAGGQLALWAASRTRAPGRLPGPSVLAVDGVVALAPVSDLFEASRLELSKGVVRDLLGGTPAEVPDRYRETSPAELLPLGVRTVLVHGTADDDVPYALSPAYVERARAAGDDVRLVTLAGAHHFDLIEPASPHWPRVVEAIASLV